MLRAFGFGVFGFFFCNFKSNLQNLDEKCEGFQRQKDRWDRQTQLFPIPVSESTGNSKKWLRNTE